MEANNNNAGDPETEAKMAKSVTFEMVATAGAVLDTKVEQEELGTEMETDSEQAAVETQPEPFEPARQAATTASPEPMPDGLATEGGGAVRKLVNYPALDVRNLRREERQRKKAEVEGAIARMVTDSMMRVEVAMEKDRAGKNLNLGLNIAAANSSYLR